MGIKIIKPGMFTTIQDQGRNGYRSYGIGPSGAMDFFAASIANILAGNKENCPVLEMHFPAPELLFEQDSIVSITGADFNAYIDDVNADVWKPIFVKKGQQLCFKKYSNGARAYLSIHGGMKADKWLNSYSTHTSLQVGGFSGRPLKKEDIIQLNSNLSVPNVAGFTGVAALALPVYEQKNNIRCIAGPEWSWMDDISKTKFLEEIFSITPQSNRMGYRLQGADLLMEDAHELVSSPVDAGTLQLLPNGQLIVLMADHQTTGGYPRVAGVIGADLPKLAQQPIHGKLQFELVSVETAEEAIASLYHTIQFIKQSCKHLYEAG
ncbi:MAG: biotin-dependent carboxyltransferase family protein [Ferruginibacter sp.]